ncbi:MAG: ADP-dependent glucokinase/phosphofructokinase [Candidatus Micrarchaeota archaeon]
MIKDPHLEAVWARRLEAALGHPHGHMRQQRVFCAFNAITDAVVHYEKGEYEKELRKSDAVKIKKLLGDFSPVSIESREDFFACFISVFSKGKALELPCYNQKLFEWFKLIFKEKIRMGGQAGIIANQLAQLQVNTVCYSPILSKEQSKLYYKESLYFPVMQHDRLVFKKPRAAYREGDPTKTNWIFEFRKGDRIRFGGHDIVCPRDNRLIVASRPKKYVPMFPEDLEEHLINISNSFDVFFLAGFQSFQKTMGGRHFRYRLQKLRRQLKVLKANRKARFHLEYVAIHDPVMDKVIYPSVLRMFDSFGINEVETVHFLKRLGNYGLADALERDESSVNYYKALRHIFHKFRLKRLHAHTLGYFLLLLRKDYVGRVLPAEFADSLLFASRVADARAFFGRTPFYKDLRKLPHLRISQQGIAALKEFANGFIENKEMAKRFLLNGIFEADDHFLIMVPTALVKPKATVGLGDTISSVAFASEPF